MSLYDVNKDVTAMTYDEVIIACFHLIAGVCVRVTFILICIMFLGQRLPFETFYNTDYYKGWVFFLFTKTTTLLLKILCITIYEFVLYTL